MDKKGELQNAYQPLQNLINKKNQLGDFTTSNLNFDRYNPVDIIITDEYDGSENIIINDDKNPPRLINSRFAVQENKTYNIPVHSGNAVTNVYEDNTFEKDTQLLKLYDNIPTLTFEGISEGGSFKCGSYIFYFKLSDADGNQTNIVQESGVVKVHMGKVNNKKVRMGMEDENAEKCIRFKLTNIDRGFDYIKIFYERASTDSSQAVVKTYFMIDNQFPIRNGVCDILLTGQEDTLPIARSDIQNEFADIQTAKTQTIVDNTLFLGNVSAYEQDYAALQQLAWRIIPHAEFGDTVGQIQSKDYTFSNGQAYYNMNKVYEKTGYWADEFYRFGIVFIYNNNILSPVFNLQGCDLNNDLRDEDFFRPDNEKWEQEPDDFFFDKKKRMNSKGVIRLPKANLFETSNSNFKPTPMHIRFDFSKVFITNINDSSMEKCCDSNYSVTKNIKEYLKSLDVKGFFFVRQKRIPTIISQGMVVGLTGRYFGCIPVLKNLSGQYITKSFLNKNRMLLETGSTVGIIDENVSNKALLVPDYDINEATLNHLYTGQEYYLECIGNAQFSINGDHHYVKSFSPDDNNSQEDVKLTAVPKDTKRKTDGENYFSTKAGLAEEAYKTEDVNNRWDKTVPQQLTASTSLIRGNWGSFVGMSSDAFNYGDIVNIRPAEFKNQDHDLLEYEKRFKDFRWYSAITPRYNISDFKGTNFYKDAYRGDCFINLFTHRMMSNFIDPELPTNTKIIDPSCWASNYGVRCTAEIKQSAHSNLTNDSDGWYIESPVEKKSKLVSLIFGILTCNIGTIINAISDMTSSTSTPIQDSFANEVVQAFEVYTGKSGSESGDTYSTFRNDDDTQQYTTDRKLEKFVKKGWIKKVNPKEQETNNTKGINLKAIFKSDDKWELHGLASINRADVNAVSFGSWITFPICSAYNTALRDVDFNNATEEATFNKKRIFYPYEDMDITNHQLESNTINGAAKVSLSDNQQPVYTTIPYIKQEYFNRIYWSKPNVAQSFINSYRIIFKNQFHEYNKEFGSITKLVSMGNQLLVVFQHGIGLLPVNRSVRTEQEASPYLSSTNVLPPQVNTLTQDYGSMWKDSVLQAPSGITYGVDTVARKIWRTDGTRIDHISDHKVSKFLNDWINLSEYDFNEYQGHINVKTHYNEFKHDVIFTYYKDVPMTKHQWIQHPITKEFSVVVLGSEYVYDAVTDTYNLIQPDIDTVEAQMVDLTGNRVLKETLDPKPLIDFWNPGKIWSLCFNEITGQWVTFYDWYPVESCNVDNVWFSFDRDELDYIYDNNYVRPDLLNDSNLPSTTIGSYSMNKVFIDKMFTETVNVYACLSDYTYDIQIPTSTDEYKTYICYYYKNDGKSNVYPVTKPATTRNYGKDSYWNFQYKDVSDLKGTTLSFNLKKDYQYADVHFLVTKDKVTFQEGVLHLQEMRTTEGPQMYLWKHGMAGLYDNQGKINPTNWYGKQHEFNFEFIVNEAPQIQKIFNNLKIISNKTAPNKFEYEVVGEGYEWYKYKPIVKWINEHYKTLGLGATDKDKFESLYTIILTTGYDQLCSDYESWNFPTDLWEFKGKTIKKIPFLHIETCDRKGQSDLNKTYLRDPENQFWYGLSSNPKEDRFSYNCSEPIITFDNQFNEERVHTESLGNDMKQYGRVRGNMQYLEDLWDIEIRPVKIKYAYFANNQLQFIDAKEARHRDKYIKIKVRYSGEDLAVIQGILTMFEYSFA